MTASCILVQVDVEVWLALLCELYDQLFALHECWLMVWMCVELEVEELHENLRHPDPESHGLPPPRAAQGELQVGNPHYELHAKRKKKGNQHCSLSCPHPRRGLHKASSA